MNIYIVQNAGHSCVLEAYNRLDAAIKYAQQFITEEEREEQIRENDDSINAYGEMLLSEWDVTEITREMTLEYMAKRLDGKNTIDFILL